MPRIRYLKPDFFKDEDLARYPFETRLCYQGLWVLADKAGRLEDRPLRLKAEIFPYDDVDIEVCLKHLSEHKNGSGKPFIHRYSTDKQRFIQIINWQKHQKPHHTEKESVIPDPPEFPLFEKPKKHKLKEKGNGKGNGEFKPAQSKYEVKQPLSNGEITVKGTQSPFSPEKQRWSDIAFQVGLTDAEAVNSYDNFEANLWKRANGIEITSWDQVPGLLRYWRNNRQNFAPKGPKPHTSPPPVVDANGKTPRDLVMEQIEKLRKEKP